MKSLFSLLALILLTRGAYAQECVTTSKYGAVSFCMPRIAGYTEGYSNENVKIIADAGRYGNNQILGYYLLSDDYDLIYDGLSITMHEYCKVFGTSELHDLDVDQKLFDSISKILNEDLSFSPELVEKGKDYFKLDELDTPITIEKYSLNNTSSTDVILLNSVVDGVRITQIATITFFLVQNRILCLAYYVDYQGQKSITNAKKGNDLMLMSIQNANK